MANHIQWTQKAVRELSKIDARYRDAIRQKVAMLADFPQVYLDIKHLQGNEYRLRHGDYRVLFALIDGVPKIVQIQKIARRSEQTYR